MYRVYCLTEDTWVTRNDTNLICPNDATHKVNQNSLDEEGSASIILTQNSNLPSTNTGLNNYLNNLYWNDLNLTNYIYLTATGLFSTTSKNGSIFFKQDLELERGNYHIIFSSTYNSSSSNNIINYRLLIDDVVIMNHIVPVLRSNNSDRIPFIRSINYYADGGTVTISCSHGSNNNDEKNDNKNTIFSRDVSIYMKNF